MSSVEFQPRTQIFINPTCMLKFYGAVITPEFTSSQDMWKITSGKEIYSTSQVTMDFDGYYSTVNFYGDQVNIKSGVVRYGSNGISTINIINNSINNMVFRNCGIALTINQGNLDVEYLICSNCENTGLQYTANVDTSFNVTISRCIFNNIIQRGISVEDVYNYYINNSFFNNNNYALYIRDCNEGFIKNNEFNLSYYHIYYYQECNHSEIHYNNFFNSICSIRPRRINNIINNNFYGLSTYFIYILLYKPPYSLVSADVNATNNYWAVEEVSQYIADAEDDPRCPYHIIYLPKLANPVRNAGIQ
jgi:hypothetical protein